MTDALQYPTAEDVLAIHEDIVASDPETEGSENDEGENTIELLRVSRTAMARTNDADTEAAYARERAELRERIRTAESDEERKEAFRRLAEIDREIHADIYEKLARE